MAPRCPATVKRRGVSCWPTNAQEVLGQPKNAQVRKPGAANAGDNVINSKATISDTSDVINSNAAITNGRWRQAKGTPPNGAGHGSLGRLGLYPLMTIEPETMTPNSDPAWEVVELAVDSGASETVIPPDLLQFVDTPPSEASRRGVMYEVANGQRIPNLGEKLFVGASHTEGHMRNIKAQVCDVSKQLMSVSRLVKAGHSVVFNPQAA